MEEGMAKVKKWNKTYYEWFQTHKNGYEIFQKCTLTELNNEPDCEQVVEVWAIDMTAWKWDSLNDDWAPVTVIKEGVWAIEPRLHPEKSPRKPRHDAIESEKAITAAVMANEISRRSRSPEKTSVNATEPKRHPTATEPGEPASKHHPTETEKTAANELEEGETTATKRHMTESAEEPPSRARPCRRLDA